MINVILSFCLSPGAVHDYCSSDHDPLLSAGRFICVRLSGHHFLSLHHSRGALRAQGPCTSPCFISLYNPLIYITSTFTISLYGGHGFLFLSDFGSFP